MRELLQQALDALRTRANGRTVQTFDEASMYAVEKQIEAELARHEWVKFSDALPVVPDGYGYIFIWLYSKKKTIHRIQYPYPENPSFIVNAHTHWLYCQDDTPQPPRSEA